MEKRESNILIDTFFTERELHPSGKFLGRKRGFPKQYENWYDTIDVSKLKYHTSWDWIMPVVERIEALGYCTSINDDETWILHNNSSTCDVSVSEGNKLQRTYTAVIQFIHHYNQTK